MRGLRSVAARVVAGVLWLAAAAAPPAAADSAQDFYAAVSAAYDPYREAIHYLDTGSAGLAALALDRAASAWREVRARFTDAPPAAYAGDLRWRATLEQIATALSNGRAAADRGDAKEALAALIPVRLELAELRLRSGQRVFSDCIDTMNAAAERLWAFRDTPPDRRRVGSIAAFKAAVMETDRWYRRCRDEAPPRFAQNQEFRRLFEGAIASLAKLDAAADGGGDRIVALLRELRAYDRLIWLRFG